MQRISLTSVVVFLVLVIAGANRSLASFHLWKIDEVYSNASGTVQFIELLDGFSGENFVQNQTLKSMGHAFTFPTNLVGNTQNHHMLLATPGYFALSSVPAADFNLGVNSFFSTSGDTLNYASVDGFAFTDAQLPKDGRHSLVRPTPGGSLGTDINSLTDFAGATGSIVPEPSSLLLAVIGSAAAMIAAVMRKRFRSRVKLA
jgi:serralysin